MRFPPNTVIYGRDLDRPDLVLVEAGRRLKRCLRMSRIDESKLSGTPKAAVTAGDARRPRRTSLALKIYLNEVIAQTGQHR